METLKDVEKLAHEVAARCGLRISARVRVVDGHEKLVLSVDANKVGTWPVTRFNREWALAVAKHKLYARLAGPRVN